MLGRMDDRLFLLRRGRLDRLQSGSDVLFLELRRRFQDQTRRGWRCRGRRNGGGRASSLGCCGGRRTPFGRNSDLFPGPASGTRQQQEPDHQAGRTRHDFSRGYSHSGAFPHGRQHAPCRTEDAFDLCFPGIDTCSVKLKRIRKLRTTGRRTRPTGLKCGRSKGSRFIPCDEYYNILSARFPPENIPSAYRDTWDSPAFPTARR